MKTKTKQKRAKVFSLSRPALKPSNKKKEKMLQETNALAISRLKTMCQAKVVR